MADVFNCTTKELLFSVNTPDYPSPPWLINPPGIQTLLAAEVPIKYWKCFGGDVVEMTQAEKDVVDAEEIDPEPTLEPDPLGSIVYGVKAEWSGYGSIGAKDVYWQRVYMPAAKYDRMQCGVVSGPNNARTLDMGVYADSGGTLPRPVGSPLVSTGPTVVPYSIKGYFFTQALSSTLTVPISGYYWLAIVSSSNSLKLILSNGKFKCMWTSRRYVTKQNYGSSTLGAVPGTFTVEDSALVYIGCVVEGAYPLDLSGGCLDS